MSDQSHTTASAKIELKQFTIEKNELGLWIWHRCGEGGGFDQDKFEEAIERFFHDQY